MHHACIFLKTVISKVEITLLTWYRCKGWGHGKAIEGEDNCIKQITLNKYFCINLEKKIKDFPNKSLSSCLIVCTAPVILIQQAVVCIFTLLFPEMISCHFIPAGCLNKEQGWSGKREETSCLPIYKKLANGICQEDGRHQCHRLAHDTTGWAPGGLCQCPESTGEFFEETVARPSPQYPSKAATHSQTKYISLV